MRRLLGLVVSGSMIATSMMLPAAPALAQRGDLDPSNECWSRVVSEARGQFAADGVDQLSSDERQGSNAETIVSGTAQANGRRFSWTCTFNIRTGQTYDVSLRQTGGDGYGRPPGRPNSGGSTAGAILGGIIAGAIIAGATSKKRPNPPREEWVSPYPGIQCSNREAACYENGRFSPYWTQRTY